MKETFRRFGADFKNKFPKFDKRKTRDLKPITPKVFTPKAAPLRSKEAASTVITISTPFGFKSFSLGKFKKRAIVSFTVFVTLLLVFGSLGLFMTFSDNKDLESMLAKTINGYQDLAAENRDLKNTLAAEMAEKEKKEAMEGLISLKTESAPIPKLDISTIGVEHKTMLLRNVPNGSPVGSNEITSAFGSRNHPVLGRSRLHEGVDLKAARGDKVYAAADGLAIGAKYNGGYGNMLIIAHAYGFTTLYAHLSRFAVKPGEFVKKGQLIAYSGNSGITSGPHLHYEVRFMDEPINPEPFVRWSYTNFAYLFEKEGKIKWASLVEATRWQTQAERLSYQAGQKSSAN